MAVSIDPDGVLALSAATLAASLNVQRGGQDVQATIDSVDDLVGHRLVVTGPVDAVAGDLAQTAGWAHDLVITYVDDDLPLQGMRTLGYWLPDFSNLGWDSSLSAAGNIDKTVRSDEFGEFVLGTGQGLLERYRQFSLYVPKPGWTPGLVPEPRSDPRAPCSRARRTTRAPTDSSCLAGRSTTPSREPARRVRRAGLVQARREGSGHGPRVRPAAHVAKIGGRSLFVAGAALTVYDSAASQWDQDEKYHPEWNTGQRVASASYSAATEGGGAVAGAWAGGEIGAMVGSFVPIPIVGTVGGALVGAAIGGFIGSKAGKAIGDLGKSAWHSLFG